MSEICKEVENEEGVLTAFDRLRVGERKTTSAMNIAANPLRMPLM